MPQHFLYKDALSLKGPVGSFSVRMSEVLLTNLMSVVHPLATLILSLTSLSIFQMSWSVSLLHLESTN